MTKEERIRMELLEATNEYLEEENANLLEQLEEKEEEIEYLEDKLLECE